MKKTSLTVGAVLAAAALIALISVPHHATRPVAAFVGTDTSRSCGPYQSIFARLILDLIGDLDPDVDHLALFRVDNDCTEFYDAAPPDSANAYKTSLLAQLAHKPKRDGTSPALFFTTVAAKAAQCPPSETVVCYFFSDGDNDDFGSDPAMTAAARALAANPHIQAVVFIGAAPTNWATIQSEFAPLGRRLHLTSQTDISRDVIDATLDSARRG